MHGLPYSVEPVELGRVALARLGLVGKGNERDRRPTDEEIEALIRYFKGNNYQIIPVDRMIRFAIATAMRLGEICNVTWEDLNDRNKTLLLRDRKDPRHKQGNHMRIPLLDVSGYDARAILEEQRLTTGGEGRIFPYNGKSAGTAFRRACRELDIEDLHFHDLRHEGTSRLFEAGFTIEQVAMVTGDKDWKMLRRYTHLRPEQLHTIAARLQLAAHPRGTTIGPVWIDLNLLVTLEALLEERSVTRAGRRLGMSQPAASRALGRLRALFADALLVDGPGGYFLSARAEDIRPMLRSTLAGIGHMLELGPFDPATATGDVRLLMADLEAAVLMPHLLARLSKEAPALDLNVRALGSNAIQALEDDVAGRGGWSDRRSAARDPPTPIV